MADQFELTGRTIGILLLTGALVHAARIVLQNRIPPWRKIVARAFLAGVVAIVAGIIGISRMNLRFEEAWVLACVMGYAGVHVLEWLGPPLMEGLKAAAKGFTKGGDGSV